MGDTDRRWRPADHREAETLVGSWKGGIVDEPSGVGNGSGAQSDRARRRALVLVTFLRRPVPDPYRDGGGPACAEDRAARLPLHPERPSNRIHGPRRSPLPALLPRTGIFRQP